MKLFVANWKMNKTRGQARTYAEELRTRLGEGIPGRELVLAPPFTALEEARDPGGRWSLGCQNVAAEPEGAFTGEVSARMAAEAGCRYAIVGHSERRRLFGEDSPLLSRKVARCREAGLTPIYCLGETAEQRDAGQALAALGAQAATLDGDPEALPLVVAYEPVWAIGTGRSATPADISQSRVHIAGLLERRSDLRILYGGSVTAESAGALLTESGIDGFLIGGASLSAVSFDAIARA